MQRRYHKPRPQKESAKPMKVNQEIRVPEVRLIDESGNNVGVVKMEEALRRAHLVDLDLIEVFPNSTPPAAKIMDYGQYKYELEKKLRKNKENKKKKKPLTFSPRVIKSRLKLFSRAGKKRIKIWPLKISKNSSPSWAKT